VNKKKFRTYLTILIAYFHSTITVLSTTHAKLLHQLYNRSFTILRTPRTEY